MTKESLRKSLIRVREQIAALQKKEAAMEEQLSQIEAAEKIKFIEKNKISMEQLILLRKISEKEIQDLLSKKTYGEPAERKEQTEYENKQDTE